MESRDWSILSIQVNTDLGEYGGDLKEDLDIDIDDLTSSFMDQPGKFAWWAVLASQARAIARRRQNEFENYKDYINKTLQSKLDQEVREMLEMDGEKITESKVEKMIFGHKEYKEAQEKLKDLKYQHIEAEADANLLESARYAMEQRKDMLISLGAHLRADGSNTELALKKKEAKQVISSSRSKK